MRISLSDRSIYLKGLMVFIMKDREIHEAERRMVIRLGQGLGFDRRFCEDTIEDIMTSRHLDDLPRFLDPRVARCLVRDAIRLSLAYNEPHEGGFRWLRSVAHVNGLEEGFFTEVFTALSAEVPTCTEDLKDMARVAWSKPRR